MLFQDLIPLSGLDTVESVRSGHLESVPIRVVVSFPRSIVLLQFGTYLSILNTEVSLFQRVGIEGFHCIQRCPHFRVWNRGVPLYTEVPSFQGVGIEEFHCI